MNWFVVDVTPGRDRLMSDFVRCSLVLLASIGWIGPAASMADDADLSEQIHALSSEDEDVRLDAIDALRDMGVAARGAQPALIGLLDDPDEYVRTAAADLLLRLGGDVELVLPLLENSEQSVQLAIARSLLVDGRKPEAAIPVLVFLATDGDDWVYADETFGAFSAGLARRTAPALLEIIKTEDDADIRSCAHNALQSMDAIGPEHVPLLVSMLRHPRNDVRDMAAERLAWLQKDAEAAVPALRAALEDDDATVRVQAALALSSFDATHDTAVNVLREIMHGGPREARLAAVNGLRIIHIPELVPQLIAGLADSDQKIVARRSEMAVTALGPAVVPELVAMVEGRDLNRYAYYQWVRIARVLGQFGNEDEDVTNALLSLSHDADPDVQKEAVNSLGQIAANEAASARLVELLESPDAEVRRVAAGALRTTTPPSAFDTVRPALRDRLLDDDPHVRVAAARSLGSLGEDATVYLPVLEELLSHKDGTVVEEVLRAYQELGPRAKPSIPHLIDALNTDAYVAAGFGAYDLCQSVPWAIAAIGAPAVPALIEVLDDPDPLVRGHAAETLGLIGADAAPAVPALVKHLSDEGQWTASMGDMGFRQTVGAVAAEALGGIGPAAKEAVPALSQRLEVIKQDELYPEDAAILAQTLSAADALGRIGRDAASAVPALWKVVENARWWEPTEAVAALARIQPGNARVVEGLRTYLLQLQRDDPLAEQHSVTAVGSLGEAIVEMGDSGRALIPTLEYLIRNAPLLEPLYRCDAAYALARIDPDNPLPERFLRQEARIEQVIGILDWAQRTLESLHDRAQTSSEKN